MCDPGNYRDVDQNRCISCSVNTYQNQSGQTSCKQCVNSITLGPGSDSVEDCVRMYYPISSVIRQGFFSFQNNPKDLDPSYKMDLDLSDCLGRVKLVL